MNRSPFPGVEAGSFAHRVLRLFDTVHPLDRIPRAGYVLRGVPEPESVAAHRERLANAGFRHSAVWLRYFNFVSIIAIR